MEVVFVLLFALAVITVVGHGLWCFIALVARSLLGVPQAEPSSTHALRREEGNPRFRELRDLNATERQLHSLAEQELLDAETATRLLKIVYQRRRTLTGVHWTAEQERTAPTPAGRLRDVAEVKTETAARDASQPVFMEIIDATVVEDAGIRTSAAPPPAVAPKPVAPPIAPAPRPAPTPSHPEPAVSSAAAAARTEVPPPMPVAQPAVEPVVRPRPVEPVPPKAPTPAAEPRESWSRLLATFMEDRNIRWGELVGGLLIVGCSIALVISLREQLEAIPYFQFVIFNGVTAALFGMGLYTAHRWKLESTSRAVLLIATLLVPLNFLSMAWLSTEGSVLYAMATGGVALAIFAWLVRLSERTILPSGDYLVVAGVIGNAAVLLLLAKLIDPRTRFEAALALGCLPAACHTLSLGMFLRRLLAQQKLDERHVRDLFVLLGVVTFATLATFSVLGFRAPQAAAVLQPLAPLVSVICIPIVAAGLLVVGRLTDEPVFAGARTAGTAIVISGLFVMAAATGLAWPRPGVAILVGLLNWAAMTVFALRANLPAIHSVALACATFAWLAGFHWLWGNLDASSDAALRQTMARALLSVQSGTAATALVIVIAIAGELMSRRWRNHGVWYAGVAVALGLASASLVTAESFYHPVTEVVARATIVYLIYGIGSLLANVRWRKAGVTYLGLGLSIGATCWALRWWLPAFSPVWPAVLGIEVLVMSGLALWCQRSVVRWRSAASGKNTAWLQQAYGEPLAITVEVLGWVVAVLGCWSAWRLRETLPWSPWHIATAGCLAASHLVLLAVRRQACFAQTAGWLAAAAFAAAAGWLSAATRQTEPVLYIACGLVVVSTALSAIALTTRWLVNRGGATLEANAKSAPWLAPLADQWLHVSLGCVAAAVVLAFFAESWDRSNLPHIGAWLAAVTCVLTAVGYRRADLTWAASALVFAGLAHLLVLRHPSWVVHPWIVALLVHSTLTTIIAGLAGRHTPIIGRRTEADGKPRANATLESLDGLILGPLAGSGLVSSAAALLGILWLMRAWDKALPTALDLYWLSALWLIVGWARWHQLAFRAGQTCLMPATIMATTAWLAEQSWVNGNVHRLLDPWSLQAYGVALALVSLVWMISRVALQHSVRAGKLLIQDPLAVDRLALLGLVLLQWCAAWWFSFPGIAREFWLPSPAAMDGAAGAVLQAHASGLGAWAVLGILASALAVVLWSRWRLGELLAAILVGATPAVLVSALCGPAVATASALRWFLAGSFLVLSATIWLRGPLRRLAAFWNVPIFAGWASLSINNTASVTHRHAAEAETSPSKSTGDEFGGRSPSYGDRLGSEREALTATVALTLCTTALPAFLLTALAVYLTATGQIFPPPQGTLLAQMPSYVSYLVPVIAIVAGFVGFALRERSAAFAFAGGLLTSLSVFSGYAMTARLIDYTLGTQLFLIASALWAIGWLAARRRVDVWREADGDWVNRTLMTVQLGIPAVGNTVLLLAALAAIGLQVAWPFVRQIGSPWGWAVLGLTVTAWVIRSRQSARGMRPEVIGLVGMAVIALLACSLSYRDLRWAYISLMMGWAMYALAVVTATWSVSARRYPQTEPPRVLIRTASVWVRVAAILAVVLGVKGALLDDLDLWGAAAIGLASASGAAMAVWLRREGWAFVAGLGANLAASLGLAALRPSGAPLWLDLLQANIIASGAIAVFWLTARRRLYAGRDLNLRAGPLLALQVSSVLVAQLALLSIAAALIFVEPWTAQQGLAHLSRPAGWLAWILAMVAALWYAGQVDRRQLSHVLGAALLSCGVLVACHYAAESQACHALLAGWLALGGVLSGLSMLLPIIVRVMDAMPSLKASREPARALSPDALQQWGMAAAWLVFVLAIRSGWKDPTGPYWPAVAMLLAALLVGIGSARLPSFESSYASWLMLSAVGCVVWWHQPQRTLIGLAQVNVLALSAGALVWFAVGSVSERVRKLTFELGIPWGCPQGAGLLALAASVLSAGVVLAGDVQWIARAEPNSPWTWVVLAANGLALAAYLLSSPQALARFALYVLGLATLVSLVHEPSMPAREVVWAYGWLLPIYVLLAELVSLAASGNGRLWQSPEEAAERRADVLDWFSSSQIIASAIALPLIAWTTYAFDEPSQRLAAPGAAALLMVSMILRAQSTRGELRRALQLAVPFLAVLVVAEAIWVAWPLSTSRWLEASVVAMTALGVISAVCGVFAARGSRGNESWSEASRRCLPVLGALFASVLAAVLVQEAILPTEQRPVSIPAVVLVAVTLVTLLLSALVLAVSPRPDPFGLSDRGRQIYVYAAELLIVVLAAHFRFSVPQLFQLGIFRRYWLFWIMACAFAGAALADFFERLRKPVLAEPLARTALFLPLLPAIGVWMQLNTQTSPLLWFLVAVFYAFQAFARRSAWCVLAATASFNLGLWFTWHQWDLSFTTHLQLWLIPPAIAALAAEHFNRDRLAGEQAAALRYFALGAIYVSSTADMFVTGIGESLILPLILALLSVAGVLLGIMLRVRAFLLLGVTFLLVVLLTMIWHAAYDRHHTWVWWVSGIVLGIAIISMFALFEKRRNDVLAAIERLRTWE